MEIFRKIKWFKDYKISNFWRVKSFKNWKENILNPWKNNKWYLLVSLCKDWVVKYFLVNRLVWQAFKWLDINNSKILVCHKDDNPLNNHEDNLFLWTQKDNMKDCSIKWRTKWWHKWKFWKNNHSSKKINQYTLDWTFIKTWDSMIDIEISIWILYQNISNCCRKVQKTCWGFIWKYK